MVLNHYAECEFSDSNALNLLNGHSVRCAHFYVHVLIAYASPMVNGEPHWSCMPIW